MSTMRIEIHAEVPTQFQDTKPTVGSKSWKQTKPSYIEVFFSMVYGPSFQYDRWRVLMRVLFSTIGSRGDVQAVWRLRST